MKYDKDEVDNMILALLFLTSSSDQYGTKAWKGFDFEALDRLYQKGLISDPKDKSATLSLSEKGAKLSKELFFKYFVIKE
ncbi:MAG TPA: DUF6429 family protein [Candidatus Marinimicrobia bacterium]|nr:DUF6429 family protein [Candidatus Neomarinimicrobiota bacterium]